MRSNAGKYSKLQKYNDNIITTLITVDLNIKNSSGQAGLYIYILKNTLYYLNYGENKIISRNLENNQEEIFFKTDSSNIISSSFLYEDIEGNIYHKYLNQGFFIIKIYDKYNNYSKNIEIGLTSAKETGLSVFANLSLVGNEFIAIDAYPIDIQNNIYEYYLKKYSLNGINKSILKLQDNFSINGLTVKSFSLVNNNKQLVYVENMDNYPTSSNYYYVINIPDLNIKKCIIWRNGIDTYDRYLLNFDPNSEYYSTISGGNKLIYF